MERLDHFKNQKVSQKEFLQLKEEKEKKKMIWHKENIKIDHMGKN